MKTKILSFLLLIFLMGCASEDDGPTLTKPIQFSAYTLTKEGESNGEEAWEKNDAVGIFMIENENKLSPTSIVDEADNKQYWAKIISNKASFDPATPQDAIYYQKDIKVDFVSYYPYSPTLDNYTYPIDVKDQSNQRKLDLLYSNNAQGIEYSQSPVSLLFEHKLSRLKFSLTAGIGAPDISKASITIEGLKTKANFDLSDGSISNIHMPKTITPNNNMAIVIPQVLGNDVELTVTINEDKFRSSISTEQFLMGKTHNYNITVNRTGISISVGNIADWIGKDDEPIDGGAEAEEYEVGDYYPDPAAVYKDGALISGNPAIGVVYWIEPHSAAKHGKITSLNQDLLMWGPFATTGAEHDSHGIYNMSTIAKYNDWASYPAFEWVHAKNKDTTIDYSNIYARGVWYLAAIDELHAMYLAYIKYDKLTTSLIDAGGNPFIKSMYSSSTGYSSLNADAINFSTGKVGTNGKRTKTYIRGILAF